MNCTGSISYSIIHVNVIYGVLIVKNFVSDGIGKTSRVDRISSSRRLSGKQFMMFNNFIM